MQLADKIRCEVQRAYRARLQGPVLMEVTTVIDASRRVLKSLLGAGSEPPSGSGCRGDAINYLLSDFPAAFFAAY